MAISDGTRRLVPETIIPLDSIPERPPPRLTWRQQEDGSWDGCQEKSALIKVELVKGAWRVCEMLDDGRWSAELVGTFNTAEAAMQAVDDGNYDVDDQGDDDER
jgi:hypothetical protein